MKKGFTLIELVVAIGILAMMLGFTSVVFRVSIKGSRVVGANAEIMQKLRGITDQLDSDFRGLYKDLPLLIWFEKGTQVLDDPNRFDQIMFFAGGDFQSTQLYRVSGNGEPVDPDDEQDDDEYITGNAARIYYGQSRGQAVNSVSAKPGERILCRRRHILTGRADVETWPVGNNLVDFELSTGGYLCNDRFEHDKLSPSEWGLVRENIYSRDVDGIVETVFWNRPAVKLSAPVTYHNLLGESVASFKIQFAYWNSDGDPEDDQLRWFPCDDPDNNGDLSDSHFPNMAGNKLEEFGIYFNVPGTLRDGFTVNGKRWYPVYNDHIIANNTRNPNLYFEKDFYPKALKFTFTIYDSKGVIKNGRTFTHIVYIGE